jgi:SHS2 domain-containing protein
VRGLRRIASDPPTYIVGGATREELFENAGYAAFAEGWHLDGVKPTYSRPIVAPGDSYEELLRNWIEELIYVSEEVDLVWAYFVVDRLEEGGVQGSAAGMPVASVRRRHVLVEGVRRLGGLVPVPEGWWIEVEFDVDSPAPDL